MTSSTDKNIRQVRLHWSGRDMVFEGGTDGGPRITVDSAGVAGPAPMQLLLLSLASCMAVDIRMILDKSRVTVDDIEVEVVGERAPDPPRRYLRIDIRCRLEGPTPADADKVQRAIDLSRDKYCSVLHSLDPSIALDVVAVDQAV